MGYIDAAFALNQTICARTSDTWNTHPCAATKEDLFDYIMETQTTFADYNSIFSNNFGGNQNEAIIFDDTWCSAEGFSGDEFLGVREQNYLCQV